MLSLITKKIITGFAKWSKPKPKADKLKQDKKSFALGDEKAAKLSKSQQEQENKLKMLQQQKIQAETKRQIGIFKSHHKSLQEFISQGQLQKIRLKQHYHLKGERTHKRKIKRTYAPKLANSKYLMTDVVSTKKGGRSLKSNPFIYLKPPVMNKHFMKEFKQIQGNQEMRRCGTLGVKLGMTTMWNRWGQIVPVTVIQLDRVQVVQVKKPVAGNKYYQVQMGIGQRNYKRMTKSLLGHFVKCGIPPKKVIAQFTVSQQCILPVGYMMTPRHYTPGMFVDVVGRTVGHGFQGTIKRYRFKRQPQTHGNSTTTRVLGSTGCRQDPGRVFKQKKMYGRMGGKITVQSGLTVFKIDVDKNLLYLKGSVPGKPGTIVKIRDTLNLDKIQKNLELVHYPTFVPEKGVRYARQMSMYCGQRDPEQIEVHDNAFMIDEDEEEAPDTPTGEMDEKQIPQQ